MTLFLSCKLICTFSCLFSSRLALMMAGRRPWLTASRFLVQSSCHLKWLICSHSQFRHSWGGSRNYSARWEAVSAFSSLHALDWKHTHFKFSVSDILAWWGGFQLLNTVSSFIFMSHNEAVLSPWASSPCLPPGSLQAMKHSQYELTAFTYSKYSLSERSTREGINIQNSPCDGAECWDLSE